MIYEWQEEESESEDNNCNYYALRNSLISDIRIF